MRFNREAGHIQEHGDDGVEDAVIELAAEADAPSLARAFLDDHRDHLHDDLIDDARLLVSELVSNAVIHGKSAIVLRVRASPPGIGIAVADTGTPISDQNATRPTQPEALATSGRGMAIVDAVASAWGVIPTDPPPGKTVWFELHA